MKKNRTNYHRHRFPPAIISHAVSLYYRFTLSLRNIEDLLAERGVIVSYETIRLWCRKFGPTYARKIKKHLSPRGDVWHMDEVMVNIQGKQYYLAKYRMSTHANKSAKCAGFGRQAMPNVSCRCTGRYTICFASGDICFAQTTIDNCEHARS